MTGARPAVKVVSAIKIIEAATAYGSKFHDCPTIVGVPVSLYDKAALLIQEAVDNGVKIIDSDFRAALGLEAPPPDADT